MVWLVRPGNAPRPGERLTAGSATTDARGRYRLANVPSGSYVAAALPPDELMFSTFRSSDGSGRLFQFVSGYYPSTVRYEEAVPIRLDASQSIQDVDFVIRLVELSRLELQIPGVQSTDAVSLIVTAVDPIGRGLSFREPARVPEAPATWRVNLPPGRFMASAEIKSVTGVLTGSAVVDISPGAPMSVTIEMR